MNYRTLPLSLICLILLAHCGDDATQDGTTPDANVDAGRDAPSEAMPGVDAQKDALADVDGADGDSASPIDAPPDVAEASAADGGDAADVGLPDRTGDAPISDARTSDGPVCGANEVFVYDDNKPGCGASAPAGHCEPIINDGHPDGSVGIYCDCAGQTISGPGFFVLVPFRSVGPCGATDGGLEQ